MGDFADPTQDPGSPIADTLAAVDLGSNSFHLLIGRVIGGQLSVIDRLREPVRLAEGLDDQGRLDPDKVERMLATLSKFRQRLAEHAPDRVRALGTNTLRKIRGGDLLQRASEALGFPIEVLPGVEEARLVYLGVSHARPHLEGRRLVVDIGGGSTECILGKGFKPIFLESLHMGCVSFSRTFFPTGQLTRKAFKRAETAAALELETLARRFRNKGWAECVGSSGTVNAISSMLREAGWTDGTITYEGVKRLRKAMIAAEHVDELSLLGLTAERTPVIAGGLAILKAVLQSLRIEAMVPSKAALREGAFYDLLGRLGNEDVRDRTIRVICETYHVDVDQAERVERTALACLSQMAKPWKLDPRMDGRLLRWAARVHEIGLAISHTGHHKHGAYIALHADMPGFSRQDQLLLAALVRGHRRKLRRQFFAELATPLQERLFRVCVLLRLAVRLNRTRSAEPLPEFLLEPTRDGLEITLPAEWLDAHPLTRADLEAESALLAATGLALSVLPPAPAD